MIAAAAVQRGWENSKRRSRAAWREARRRARDRAEQRAQAARRRADARRQWYHRARANPRHPVAWGYGLGWGLAAAGAAIIAGLRGARDGARAGARHGARAGRRAAREGWGLGTAWREYRAQRNADETQQVRRAQHEGRACGCGCDDPRWLVAAEGGAVICTSCLRWSAWDAYQCRGHIRDGRACHTCGADNANLLVTEQTPAGERRAVCVPCLLHRRQQDADRGEQARQEPPPVLVSCLLCRAPLTREVAEITGGYCPPCADQNHSPQAEPATGGDNAGEVIEDAVVLEDLPTCARCGRLVEGQLYATADGEACCPDCTTGDGKEDRGPDRNPDTDTQADRTDDGTDEENGSTDRTDGEDQEPMSQAQSAISLNGTSLSGGDGEGYAGTVTALEQMAHLLENAHQVSTDLGDQVTAKNVDADTITGLSALADHIQAGVREAQATLAHVQSKHSGVAAEIAGAGGSTEIADTDWYDHY